MLRIKIDKPARENTMEVNVDVPQCNTAIVVKAMEFSRHGALAQLFIVDAIRKQADAVAGCTVEELKEKFGSTGSIIAPEVWHAVAKEIQKTMNDFYGRHGR